MGEFLPELDDLADDLERRIDIATMMVSSGWAQGSARGVVTYSLAGQDDSIGAQLAAFAASEVTRTPAGMALLDQRLARYGADGAVMSTFYDALGADGLVALMSDIADPTFVATADIEVRRSLLEDLRAGLQTADARWGDLHAGMYAADLVDAATAAPAVLAGESSGADGGVLTYLLMGSTFSTAFLGTLAEKIDTYERVEGVLDPWAVAGVSPWARYLDVGTVGALVSVGPSAALMTALRGNAAAFRGFFASGADVDLAAARAGYWWAEGDEARLMIAEVSAAAGRPGVSVVDVSPTAITHWWAGLSAGSQEAAQVDHWAQLGNLDGMPYGVRVACNRAAITAAVEQATAEQVALEAQIAAMVQDASLSRTHGSVNDWDRLTAARAELATLEATLARYDKLLHETTKGFDADGVRIEIEGHQVVVFAPESGRFGELVGSLTAATTSIGVLVGGTGTNLTNMPGQYTRAGTFVHAARPPGSLAVITYLGGPMPQTIPRAVDTHYALDAAAGLRDFAAGISRPAGAEVTVLGHSYGGSLVGAAEHVGMVVDRILLVEAAGAGPGVSGVQDYASPQTPRYSMTAPGDPIGYIQGLSVGEVGHGADPDDLAGVVRLETGLVDNKDRTSDLLEGMSAHGGVFTKSSTAWTNMLGVLTGSPVMLYTEPQSVLRADETVEVIYPMQDPDYDPPMMAVP